MAALTAVPWIAVSLVDLTNAQAGPLVTAFQSTALYAGPGAPQTDPTTQVIADISAEILGAVGFSGRYTMDASQGLLVPDLIPPNLKPFCVAKVVRLMRQRLEMDLKAAMIEDERTYQRVLSALRAGQYPVDATNNPSGVVISVKPGLATLNYGYHRRFQPHQLNDL